MPAAKDPSDGHEHLRQQAEAILRERPDAGPGLSMDILELIQELRIHQAELEIQNEELQRAQGELSLLHQAYERLYEFAPCGYLVLDTRGIITNINLTGIKILGGQRTLILDRGFSTFIDPRHEASYFSAFRKSAETGGKKSVELLLKDGSDAPVWVRAEIDTERSETGAAVQCRMVLLDITERKLAEEANRVAREWQTTFEASNDAIWILSHDHRVLRTNKTAEKYFSRPRAEIIGEYCWEIVHGTDRPVPECLVLSAQKSLHREMMELQIGDKWFQATVDPIVDGNGRYQGAVYFARDISQFKEAEEAGKRLEFQLQQAQKLEAVGTLSGGIAHDFNNILSIILGNTELAMEDLPEWTPARDNLQEVLKECRRARDVIQQILSFSRRAKSEMRLIDMVPIVNESVKLLRASIPASIEIRKNVGAEMKTILGDSTQIHQVLLNLCTNAAHAMEKKGGVLNIDLTEHVLDDKEASHYPDVDPGRYFRLTVTDTGCGMTPETMDRIFDPYFTTKEPGKGTGMGLAVVHGIMKRHGGAISVSSEPGEGTTFEILFPAIEEQVAVEKSEASKAMLRGHERILFVDDETALVRLNERRMTQLGYRVEARTDPEEALKSFRSRPDRFNLIITDMTMPRMTGDVLAREAMKIRPDIPILLCTGYSDRIDKEKAKKAGIAGFAMKPLDMAELAGKVRELLDRREKQDE